MWRVVHSQAERAESFAVGQKTRNQAGGKLTKADSEIGAKKIHANVAARVVRR